MGGWVCASARACACVFGCWLDRDHFEWGGSGATPPALPQLIEQDAAGGLRGQRGPLDGAEQQHVQLPRSVDGDRHPAGPGHARRGGRAALQRRRGPGQGSKCR